MRRFQAIIWPLPSVLIEPWTATTVVITGERRVLVYGFCTSAHIGQVLRFFPFMDPTPQGRVCELGHELRTGVVNLSREPVTVVGYFECYPLEAATTDVAIEEIWAELERADRIGRHTE